MGLQPSSLQVFYRAHSQLQSSTRHFLDFHSSQHISNARLTLEQQIMSLESAQTQSIAVGALQEAVKAQKVTNKNM